MPIHKDLSAEEATVLLVCFGATEVEEVRPKAGEPHIHHHILASGYGWHGTWDEVSRELRILQKPAK